jgi:hypothetical protein
MQAKLPGVLTFPETTHQEVAEVDQIPAKADRFT